MRNKYGNKKTVIDGITFDSKKEANYYGVLKLRLRAGEIKSFTMQETFEISINNVKVCKYIADFVIVELSGLKTAVDVKSEMTRKLPVYRIKKKLMKAVHGIDIIEI